jgi:excisionase family DNA binding protein
LTKNTLIGKVKNKLSKKAAIDRNLTD